MIGLRTIFHGFMFCHCVNDLAPSGNSACRSRWPPSKVWVCGDALVRIAGSNPAGGVVVLSLDCCALSGRGLCVGPITRPEESCRVWCV